MWTLQRFHQSISHAHVSRVYICRADLVKANLWEKFTVCQEILAKGEGTFGKLVSSVFRVDFLPKKISIDVAQRERIFDHAGSWNCSVFWIFSFLESSMSSDLLFKSDSDTQFVNCFDSHIVCTRIS